MASSTGSGNGSSNNVSVAVTSMPGGGTATVLSGAQASQLLSKLRAMNPSGPMPQTIKIQTIQTNPQTGAKQIVAIPIQSSQQSSTQRVIRMPASLQQSGTHFVTTSAPGPSGLAQNVRIVKLSGPTTSTASGSTATVQRQMLPTRVMASRPTLLTSASHQPQPVSVVSASSPSAASSSTSFTIKTYSPHTSSGGGQGTSRGAIANGSRNIIVETGVRAVQAIKRSDIDFDSFADAKRRKTSEKGGKGLRHFSMKVCEKVQAKGTTSYNEVADELVNELTDPRCASPTDQQYDQKNIRRRVYDALNVLMAMNIISKEKKEIRWLGLPTNSVQEANSLELDKAERIDRIKAKTQQLQDLILQQIAFKNLVERNRDREKRSGAPAPNSAIQLPFIIVNTGKETVIDCSISNDKREYLFNFDNTFEIHDDMEVLKRMGLSLGLEEGTVSPGDLARAQAMVPRALQHYVIDLAKNGLGSCVGMPYVSPPMILKEDHPNTNDTNADDDENNDDDLDSNNSGDSESEVDLN